MSDANFANGLIVKRPHQNAPAFIKCSLSFKVDDFIQCLQQNNNNGWVNMDVKLAKDNQRLYAEIDNWQPNQQQAPPQQQNYQQPAQQQQGNQGGYQAPPYPQPNEQFQQPRQQPQQQQNYNQQPQQNAAPAQDFNSPPFNPTDDIPF